MNDADFAALMSGRTMANDLSNARMDELSYARAPGAAVPSAANGQGHRIGHGQVLARPYDAEFEASANRHGEERASYLRAQASRAAQPTRQRAPSPRASGTVRFNPDGTRQVSGAPLMPARSPAAHARSAPRIHAMAASPMMSAMPSVASSRPVPRPHMSAAAPSLLQPPPSVVAPPTSGLASPYALHPTEYEVKLRKEAMERVATPSAKFDNLWIQINPEERMPFIEAARAKLIANAMKAAKTPTAPFVIEYLRKYPERQWAINAGITAKNMVENHSTTEIEAYYRSNLKQKDFLIEARKQFRPTAALLSAVQLPIEKIAPDQPIMPADVVMCGTNRDYADPQAKNAEPNNVQKTIQAVTVTDIAMNGTKGGDADGQERHAEANNVEKELPIMSTGFSVNGTKGGDFGAHVEKPKSNNILTERPAVMQPNVSMTNDAGSEDSNGFILVSTPPDVVKPVSTSRGAGAGIVPNLQGQICVSIKDIFGTIFSVLKLSMNSPISIDLNIMPRNGHVTNRELVAQANEIVEKMMLMSMGTAVHAQKLDGVFQGEDGLWEEE